MKKILIVAPFLPAPPDNGGRIRLYNLLKNLSLKHDISLLSYIEPDQIGHLDEIKSWFKHIEVVQRKRLERGFLHLLKYTFTAYPITISIFNKEFKDKFIYLINTEKFDLIQFEFIVNAHLVKYIPDNIPTTIVIHAINFESVIRGFKIMKFNIRKIYSLFEIIKIKFYEDKILKKIGNIIVTSDRDKEVLLKRVPISNIHVVPNGVDTVYFSPVPVTDEKNIIGFIGAFNTEISNIDAVIWFTKEVFPHIKNVVPDILFEIIGPGAPLEIKKLSSISENIVIRGYVDDVRVYLSNFKLLVLPLRGGSGTKVRVFTALSMGIPVVTTVYGAEGINDVDSEHGLFITKDTKEMVDIILKLIQDKNYRDKVGNKGREIIVDKYDWKIAAKKMDFIWESIAENSSIN